MVGGKISWAVYGNNEYDVQITSTRTVADGQWHHIVAVREANGTGQVFIDGQLDSTQSGPDVALGSGFLVYLGADKRNAYYGSSPSYFNGLIDQVGIYNQALSQAAIQAIYSNHGGAPATQPEISGLVGQWKGEGNANDSGGFDNATMSGSVSYSPGVVGQAFQFTGTGSVVASDSPALDSATFTIAGWFKIDQAPRRAMSTTSPASTTAITTAGFCVSSNLSQALQSADRPRPTSTYTRPWRSV